MFVCVITKVCSVLQSLFEIIVVLVYVKGEFCHEDKEEGLKGAGHYYIESG